MGVQSLPELADYDITEWRDDDGLIVYRGVSAERRILAVTPAHYAEPADATARLRHAFSLRDAVDSAWAAKPVALIERGPAPVLLIEHPGGDFLDHLDRAPAGNLAGLLDAATGVATALQALHARGLVHKNLKPANVLVEPTSGQAWLTGFWLASRSARGRLGSEAPSRLLGTLAYTAPEQTGRVNRSVDARADLYSFGVLLYELFTGSLPLTATTPAEWIHAHVARLPAAFDSRALIPEPVQAIILKLLAKSAEDRYQTAAGVAADLQRCLDELRRSPRLEPFALGRDDVAAELVIPERLYGRELEVAALLGAFERVRASGVPELVLVSGYSGIGKSSLVHELQKALVSRRGHLASGKFDLLKRDVPYAPLAQALRGRVRAILAANDAELERWRRSMRLAVGGNGQLVVALIPELKLVLGEQPPPVELPPDAAKRRFQSVLRRFIAALAEPSHPLAVFLDDLQWLDAATLEFLEHLVAHAEVRHLLLIGAYRDNEVGPDHPLHSALAGIRAAGATIHEIALRPLTAEDLGSFLSDTLRCDVERCTPLAELIHQKTRGNPFFAVQFLTMLADGGHVAFDREGRAWTWAPERIRAQAFTDNVADLVLDRIRRLPGPTREALRVLACLGDRARVTDLCVASGQPEDELSAALVEAVDASIVRAGHGEYGFLHDRLREASYALTPESERAAAHLAIGRRLAGGFDQESLEERIFDVVDQLERAEALLVARAERESTAELHRIAGRRARASAAPESALRYFEAGLRMLDRESLGQRHDLAFSLSLQRIECVFLCGDLQRTERLLGEILPAARTRFEIASVRRLYVILHVMKSEYAKAVGWAIEALRPFDIQLTPHPSREDAERAYAEVLEKLGTRTIEELIDLPTVTDEEVSAPMRVLAELFAPACFTDESLAFLHLCRMVTLTLERGTTEASAHAFAWFGVMLGHFFGEYETGSRFVEVARGLVKRHGFATYEAKTLFSAEIVRLWTRPLSEAIDAIRAAFQCGIESGDLPVACFACNHVVNDRLVRGDSLDDVLNEIEESLIFVRRAGYRDVIAELVSQHRYVQALRGCTDAVSTFDDGDFDAAGFEAELTPDRMPTMIFWHWVLKAQVAFLGGELGEAWQALQRAHALRWSSPVHIQFLNYHLFSALTLTALHERPLAGLDDRERRARLEEHRAKLEHWARGCPETFEDKLLLLDAEFARVEGRDLEAIHLYERAMLRARAGGFVHNEALAAELAARFHRARGFATAAFGYERTARNCYARWGAKGKVRQLEAQHPELRRRADEAPTVSVPIDDLDVKTVLAALQAVSRELVLERLVETVMRSAVQTAGADRGVLVVLRDEAMRVEAEAVARGQAVEIVRPEVDALSTQIPESILNYVFRARDPVLLDDATGAHGFSEDAYLIQRRPRSVLCLPIVNQTRLSGALYLENSLTGHVFTPRRVAELGLLAAQAAISLENARLYRDLERENAERTRAEGLLAGEKRLLEMVAAGTPVDATLDALCGLVEASFSGLSCSITVVDNATGGLRRRTSESDHTRPNAFGPSDAAVAEEAPVVVCDIASESRWPEFRERARAQGLRACWAWPIVSQGKVLGAFALGLREPGSPTAQHERLVDQVTHIASIAIARARSDHALLQLRSELAHVMRVATLGELTASIAHEVNQPLSGISMNGQASLRWIEREPPNLAEVRAATVRIVRDAARAGETISRLRGLFRKTGPAEEHLDLNLLITEVIAIIQHEAQVHRATVVTALAPTLPVVLGDRVQIQQVLLNLLLNGVQAMAEVGDRPRTLTIFSSATDDRVEVGVTDSGVGAGPTDLSRLFAPFMTTKQGGMGMGLSISRSIVEAHGGRIWAEANDGAGLTFRFVLPSQRTA